VGFSEAQFNETIHKITQGLDDLAKKIDEVMKAANEAMHHWYVPAAIKEAIKWCAEKICELAKWFWNKIKDVLKGAAAPILFFRKSWDWEDIRGLASGVTGQLKPEAMPAANSWAGQAAAAYKGIIKPQGDAANKIATISDKTSSVLNVCAMAGLTFYLAIAVILIKFIDAMIAAIAAFGSGVFSGAGAAIVVEEVGVNTTTVVGLIAGLTTALGAQAQQMIGLHGEAIDNSSFPGGHWPNATTGNYNNGSVQDGHAYWSLDR
jgi:hypothetical protein